MEELWLRRTLKKTMLGLASLERTIQRQCSRIRWLQAGDANSKLFQAMANGRRAKNFITHIKHQGKIITDQDMKQEVITEEFECLLGRSYARRYTLDLQ